MKNETILAIHNLAGASISIEIPLFLSSILPEINQYIPGKMNRIDEFHLSKTLHNNLTNQNKNEISVQVFKDICILIGKLPIISHAGEIIKYETLKENLEFLLEKHLFLSEEIPKEEDSVIKFLMWKFALDINEVYHNKIEFLNIEWIEKYIHPRNIPQDEDFEYLKERYLTTIRPTKEELKIILFFSSNANNRM